MSKFLKRHCPEKAETLMTPIRVRIRVCQQKMKTPARLRTGHGTSKCVRRFLKEKCCWRSTDQTAIMSKPAYLSVEVVTDNSTSGKISIP